MPCFIGRRFPATAATVKCPPSDCNIVAIHTIVGLLMDESHFILLHSALKLKKCFISVREDFRNPFLLCCVSFCLLGKI